MLLYFAYGSNLDQQQLRSRCPGAVLLSVGSLPDYRLAFTAHSSGWNAGVADVVAHPGERVWGIVYRLLQADLDALDTCEGYPDQYTRFVGAVETPNGAVEAWVYTVVQKSDFVVPSSKYLEIIQQAALRCGFPETYVRMLEQIRTIDP